MGQKILLSIWFIWLLATLFFALVPLVRSQMQGCSMQNIDIGPCLTQGNSYRPDACCNALNQVIHAGFSCICSLLVSSLPLSSTPISFPLPNCYISLPPLSLCGVLAPLPVVIAPARPGNQHPASPSPPAEDQMQSPISGPVNLTRHPAPPLSAVLSPPSFPPAEDQRQSPSDTNGQSDSAAVQMQPCSAENAEQKLDLFGSRLLFPLVILLHGSMFLA